MASSIPWFFVLEALGHIKQVDPALLIELVKKTPEISDGLGENAREVISLRTLEDLYNRGIHTKHNYTPPSGLQIGLDPSDCCEDVLSRILQEESAENLKLGGLEILKWDIHSFVMHKRSCLPSYSLRKLKDGILGKNHPFFTLLQGRSGLAVTNESQSEIPIDGGDSNGIAHKPEGSSCGIQIDEHNQNLLPAKRCRNATITESYEGQSHDDQDTFGEASKKLKHDLVSLAKNVQQIAGPVQQQGEFSDSSAGKDHQTRHMEESRSHEGHPREADASTNPTLKNYVSPIGTVHYQQNVLQCDKMVPGETSGEGHVQNNIVNEAKGHSEDSLEPPTLNGNIQGLVSKENRVDEANNHLADSVQQNAADGGNIKDGDKHCNHPEILSDGEYHDERIDIATKKNAFFSSQCTYSQDSLATQLDICVKCNENGHLLVCSSNTCPLVVHKSCLGSTANFDANGNFYCPFCAYSRAISEYLEAKKKASLRRKDLAAFIGLRVEHHLKKPSMRSRVSKHENKEANNPKDSLNEVQNPQSLPYEANNNKDSLNEVNNHLAQQNEENNKNSLNEVSDIPCGEKETDTSNEPRHLPRTVCQSTRGHGSERPVQVSELKLVSHQSKSDPPHESDPSHESDPPHESTCRGIDGEESSEEENEKAVASKYSIRFRKEEKQHTYPVVPQPRRKRHLWTKIEEEKLEEGVQKFGSDPDKNIPWRKILEFGGDVFHESRTPTLLKDKWKKLCKESATSK